jgi:hypothetical protein
VLTAAAEAKRAALTLHATSCHGGHANNRDVAVVLSVADYERLRGGVVQAFLDLRNDVAGQAGAAGLTEERQTELLGED